MDEIEIRVQVWLTVLVVILINSGTLQLYISRRCINKMKFIQVVAAYSAFDKTMLVPI